MTIERFWHGTLKRPYSLHTERYGDPALPPIILIHGIAASGEDWHTFVPLLTPYYYCITIDLLGFGRSPRPQWAEYTTEQHLLSLRYTIRRLGLRHKYVLAGHSFGSLLATQYVRRYPLRVCRLLLLSPPVYPPLKDIASKAALRRTDLLMRTYAFLRANRQLTMEKLRRLKFIMPLPRSLFTHPDTWIPFARTLEHCIETQTILEDIRVISIPTDVFYGKLDTVVIGKNVDALGRLGKVTIHTFGGNHNLSNRYARLVVGTLQPPNKLQKNL
jgi:pimeloyl-ACP methyl ester carboxylesterase